VELGGVRWSRWGRVGSSKRPSCRRKIVPAIHPRDPTRWFSFAEIVSSKAPLFFKEDFVFKPFFKKPPKVFNDKNTENRCKHKSDVFKNNVY
jgi:hypothetical protein